MEVAGSDGEGRRALSPPWGALPAYQVSLNTDLFVGTAPLRT